jgi:hypothetical protein
VKVTAQSAEQLAQPAEPLDEMHIFGGRWTAQRALAELPETTIVTIEVVDGSLVVSPRLG